MEERPVETAAVAEEEGGVVADLLEPQEEQEDLRAPALPLGLADPLEEGLRRGAVERRLLAREADPLLRLDLVGEVGRDGRVGLRAPQEERRGEAPEPLAGDRVVVPLDRDREGAPEGLVGAEEAGVEEVEDRLELGEAVLERRAREGRAARGAQGADGLRLRGAGVLDVLRLVEGEVLPRHVGEERPVAVGEGVGRDEEVGLLHEGDEVVPRGPLGAVVDGDGEARREARGLLDPVLDDGGGADEERRADRLARLARRQEGREELDRLAEAHVVGEAAAEPAREEEAEPGDALLLVGAQAAQEGLRRDEGRLLRGRVGLEELGEPAVGGDAVDAEGLVVVLVEAARHAEEVGEGRAARGLLLEEGERAGDALRVEEDPLAPHLDERDLAVRELLELVGGEELVADGDAPVEVDEGPEAEARDGDAALPAALGGVEAERGLRRAPLGREEELDAGFLEQGRVGGEEAPRLLEREGRADRVPFLEAPPDRLAERGDAAEAREEGLLGIHEPAPEAPQARGGLGPDLLGVELEARVVRRLEVVAEAPRGRLLGGRVGLQEPHAEAQVALGERLEERDAPGAEALGHLGRDRLGDRLVVAAVAARGEEGEGEPLGAAARPPARVGEPFQEELARGGVGHVVDDGPQEEGRGRVEPLGRGARPADGAARGGHRLGEEVGPVLLVRVRQDGAPARAALLHGRDDPPAVEEVEDPGGDGDPVVDVVAQEEPGAVGRLAHGDEGVEGAAGGKDEALDLEGLQDSLAAGVVLVLAEGGVGGHRARAERRERQDDAAGPDVPGGGHAEAGGPEGGLERRRAEVARVLGPLPRADESPFSPEEEPRSGQQARGRQGVSVED